MENSKILTTNDLIFKKVFGSPKYSYILIGFIEDILGLKIEELTIENPYNINSFYSEKEKSFLRTEVDIFARLDDGSLVTIELQLSSQRYFKERALYYAAEKYTENYANKKYQEEKNKSSEIKYSSLRVLYGINILDFLLFKEDEAVIHNFTLYDRENQMIYESAEGKPLFNITFLELRKQTDKNQRRIKYWMDYFLSGKVEEEAPKYIKDACKIAEYQNLDKEEKEMIDAIEKAREDYKAGLYSSFEEGLERGLEQGIEQGLERGLEQGLERGLEQGIEQGSQKKAEEIAFNLMNMGIDEETIIKASNLSLEDIRKLRDRN